MLRSLATAFAAVLLGTMAFSQNKSEVKNYPRNYAAGEVNLVQQWTENDGARSATAYIIDVPVAGTYSLAIVSNLQTGSVLPVSVDDKATSFRVIAVESGWQKANISALTKNDAGGLYLTAGRHTIKLSLMGNMPPLVDQVSFSRSGSHPSLDANWQQFAGRIAQWKQEQPVSIIPAANKYELSANKVLSNPAGNYDHAIDTAFSYSTFQFVYLSAGIVYTFSTNNSTTDPVLHLFDPANIDTRSWYSDDYNGTYESNLVVNIPVTGYYALLARPFHASVTGITNIQQNGVPLLSNTPIAGQRFSTSLRTGNLNYFTAKLTGTNPDTRIFTLYSSGGMVTGYNDDYGNTSGGTWNWSLCSRIKKNYAAASPYVYVCAYSSAKTGICDLYMGNVAASLPTSGEAGNFPLLKGEDAIQTAPGTGVYNCIAWSGGITSSWEWPPSSWSTWYVAGNPLAGFDKFYSNTPARFPGAWNYTRTGATVSNSVVDLWKTAIDYTHASVTKPGNNNPHGYDWESKPGGFDRTLHPRNALEKADWYGYVSNYYKPTGTYARVAVPAGAFETDMDAVKAGVAVIDRAMLTTGAQEKLRSMLSKADASFISKFNELYAAWDKTKARNASLSDPSMYCKNAEFEKLAAFSQKNTTAAMLLVFDKFVNNGDHYIGELLLSLTTNQYGRLLTEVRTERLDNPNDAQGRYKIHGDHDNGVLYVEKILKQLDEKTIISPVEEPVTITISPNPVKDQFTVQVNLKTAGRISIQAVSSQSRVTKELRSETELPAGTHRFSADTRAFNSSAGDIIAVQVKVNGVLHTAKVLVL
ncbi:MAG TPA: hypothetical protein VGO58_07965 [Chitinophagaceae bacterium]|jgi:hypothetical protein|nr:hypothetical protein [Chitinophagaceae bacterium]